MSDVEDMLRSGVMAEPRWPRCARCDVAMVERKDPKTGRPVREGGRALLECPRCGDLVIGPEPRGEMRRYRLIRVMLVTGGAAASGGTVLLREFLLDGPQAFENLGVYVLLVLIAGMGLCLHLALEAAARALTMRNAPDVRLTWWAYVIFWAAAVAMQGWLMVRVGWPLMTGKGRAPGSRATVGWVGSRGGLSREANCLGDQGIVKLGNGCWCAVMANPGQAL